MCVLRNYCDWTARWELCFGEPADPVGQHKTKVQYDTQNIWGKHKNLYIYIYIYIYIQFEDLAVVGAHTKQNTSNRTNTCLAMTWQSPCAQHTFFWWWPGKLHMGTFFMWYWLKTAAQKHFSPAQQAQFSCTPLPSTIPKCSTHSKPKSSFSKAQLHVCTRCMYFCKQVCMQSMSMRCNV